jgi:hypothetical protein
MGVLVMQRDSVFMAFSFGMGPEQPPFWRKNAFLAHPHDDDQERK